MYPDLYSSRYKYIIASLFASETYIRLDYSQVMSLDA